MAKKKSADKKITHVSTLKKKAVQELSKLIDEKNTILIASIMNIPASQVQEIGKKFRGKAVVKVPKRNLILRAIDNSKNETLNKIEEKIKENVALFFSDLDSFELASELIENKKPAKAKPGQEAPIDIEIPAGPTDLLPGPAISELGALGIKVQIEGGKIVIREPKMLVKKGEKISNAAADLMNKLDIKPFSIGFIPVAAFDKKEGKLYLNIQIDREKTLADLKCAFGRALPFAVQIGYVCNDTIKFLLAKANSHAKALEKFETQSNKIDGGEIK
jgi:large subunit ribosomal protein L10